MKFFNDIQNHIASYYDVIIETLPKLVLGIVVFFIIWLLAKQVCSRFSKMLERRNGDPLLSAFIGRIAMTILMIVGFLVFLRIIGLGSIAAGLLGTAGVGAFVIGFAFKDIGENFLSGFTLAFDRPFNVGDLVELGGQKGKVISLNLRTTHLKTFDGRDLYIPNAKIIKETLVNYTVDGYMRHNFTVGLDRNDNIDLAIGAIVDEMKTVDNLVKQDKPPFVIISDIDASRVSAKVYYWLDTMDSKVDGGVVRNKAISAVLRRLEKDKFYLPSDIVEIRNYQEKSIATKGESTAA